MVGSPQVITRIDTPKQIGHLMMFTRQKTYFKLNRKEVKIKIVYASNSGHLLFSFADSFADPNERANKSELPKSLKKVICFLKTNGANTTNNILHYYILMLGSEFISTTNASVLSEVPNTTKQ